jgi:hypothetical protein
LEKHNNNLLNTALRYREAGLSIIPCHKESKAPAIKKWKPYQSIIADPKTIMQWFSNNTQGIGLVCGKVSGNLEVLDFDCKGELFEPFCSAVDAQQPRLISQLMHEKSQSGGDHLFYRCLDMPIPCNKKLALKLIEVSGPGEHFYKAKRYTAYKANGNFIITPDLIETRGEGGYFLADPSPGYKLIQGDFAKIPCITVEQREILMSTAAAFNQHISQDEIELGYKPVNGAANNKLPGQDFSERGDVRPYLEKHLWSLVKRSGDKEYWRRPGKDRA